MSSDTDHPAGDASEPSDLVLLEAARAGDEAAFGTLWARHRDDARRVVRAITQSFDADDVVAEAFTAIWKAIRAGKGPSDAFRPYLLATVRNVIAGWGRARREDTPGFFAETADPRSADLTTFAEADASLVMRALGSLPERWREVLWMTEVEALQPAEVAEKLGMSANGAAALAYRAREGLRQAWIQAHVDPNTVSGEHQWALEHIGQRARNTLSARNTTRFDSHLVGCESCRDASRIAVESSASFTSSMLPLAVGVLAAAGTGLVADAMSTPAAHAAEGIAVAPPPANSSPDGEPARFARRRRLGVALLALLALLVVVGAGIAVALSSWTNPSTSEHGVEVGTSPSAPNPSSSRAGTSSPAAGSPSEAPTPPAPAPIPEATAGSDPSRPSTPAPSQTFALPPLGGGVVDSAFAMSSVDTGNGLFAPIVSGTGRPGASVVVTIGRVSMTTDIGADGRWQTAPIDVRPGTYTVTSAADGSVSSRGEARVSSPVVSVATEAGAATVTIRGGANTDYRVTTGDASVRVETDGSGVASLRLSAPASDVVVSAVSGQRTGPPTVIPVPGG